MMRKPKHDGSDKLPRGHAYIRMRNRGLSIDIDYCVLDSAQAERIMKAAMAIAREEEEMPNEES